MISRSSAAPTRAGWQRLLTATVTVDALLRRLELDPAALDADGRAARDFPLRVPAGFVARMRKGDPRDPLLLQVLPVSRELRPAAGYTPDPLDEPSFATAPGLLHKYRGRALLVVTGACAVHCRYCFRRHFPYAAHAPRSGWSAAVAALAADRSIEEVILSGGDPLTLPDDRLAELAEALAALPHLRRLRLHTRLPIVLPERVDEALCAWLTGTRLRPVVVVHVNHPNEVDDAVRDALGRLRRAAVPLLNQAVLLRRVNDDAAVLAALSRTLFEAGVLPYYLHLLDPVAGAAHFAVPEAEARDLARRLREELPGYLVPRLVREVPGAASKEPL